MSWLSAAWGRNKGAIAKTAGAFFTGGPAAAAAVLANDARKEVGRVINRSGASPEAKAVLTAQAENAINAGEAAAGANAPGYLNPLGAQGTQKVAIGGSVVSVNTLALAGGAVILLVIIMMMAKR